MGSLAAYTWPIMRTLVDDRQHKLSHHLKRGSTKRKHVVDVYAKRTDGQHFELDGGPGRRATRSTPTCCTR